MSSGADDLFAAVRAGNVPAVEQILARDPGAAAARDGDGATPLHYAAAAGHRELVRMLLDAGADVNARDLQFGATPAGWAIEYLRERGALLAIEIEDVRYAIARGDGELVRRYLARLPGLRDAVDADGTPLKVHANSGNADIARLFRAR